MNTPTKAPIKAKDNRVRQNFQIDPDTLAALRHIQADLSQKENRRIPFYEVINRALIAGISVVERRIECQSKME